ncbi:alpha/beta hydrolase [Streptomyces sp. SID2119]|uniref:esterase/lipase family protein n=1 Tax=Streptomyces sp. SID2119 TaxID=2690253 RepID=UPI001F48CB23|nr:alpha/beta hydrolase [Streptomyces sp. SID2119]
MCAEERHRVRTAGREREQAIGAFTLAGSPQATAAGGASGPTADEEWELPGGFARVYHADSRRGLVRPVLLADGFNHGRSDLDALYLGLEESFPLIGSLKERGHDVVLLGYDDRGASILDNARTATAAILRAIATRGGDAPLTVGGFSMGGIVTRYAPAKMEQERIDHQTALHFSYDSPHRGAVIPIGLQAFAHFIPVANNFAKQMNSSAARQMLWRHYDSERGTVGVDPEREKFLEALGAVGVWPQRPRRIAVVNGRGDGQGPRVPPGQTALASTGDRVCPGTVLLTQAEGHEAVVAELKRLFPKAGKTITTSGFPPLDGAPGGTLGSCRILASTLEKFGATVDPRHPDVCFVPTVSAVAIRDPDRPDDLYADVDSLPPEDGEVDEFLCSSETTGHTAITEELCTWLLDRLPRR